MFSKLKQVRNLQSKAKEIQNALGQERAEGSGGWGKVKVVVDGNQNVISVTIDPSVMSDKTKLEEMVREAANDAMNKIRKVLTSKMKDLGGLDIAREAQEMLK